MALIGGVVKLIPEPRDPPPVAAEYQFIVPVLAVAPNVTVPVPHLEAGVVFVIVGIVLIMARTIVLEGLVQPFIVAST